MESLGSKLKTAREAKGLSIDFISQETNIAGRYLDALEREEFTVFPGEAYLLGFLKNYGAYLELNVNELLSMYRSFKIQEQPVPVDELLKSPSKLPKILAGIAITLVVLALAAGAVWFFLLRQSEAAGETPPPREPAEYTMTTESLERRFYPGDSILVPLDETSYKLELAGLADTITLNTPVGPVRLGLSQEASLDLNGDGFSELLISVADFDRDNSDAGAQILLEQKPVPGTETTVVAAEPLAPNTPGTLTLIDSPNAYPFTLQVEFQGYCLFRWEVLFEEARQGRNERYYQNADELSIQAQNGVRIGFSNAASVRLQVIGGGRTVPLDSGGAGEVVVAEVRWIRTENNRYQLVMTRLE